MQAIAGALVDLSERWITCARRQAIIAEMLPVIGPVASSCQSAHEDNETQAGDKDNKAAEGIL
jgi:hypothetical protein